MQPDSRDSQGRSSVYWVVAQGKFGRGRCYTLHYEIKPNEFSATPPRGLANIVGLAQWRRASPTRNSFLPSGMLNRDHYHARKNYYVYDTKP
ncbi:hypothetical protein J6590_042805 [Homalodisca vitripennis]|nr:hypothetical protein J6590_042805 [Homalodisca vitripennis]